MDVREGLHLMLASCRLSTKDCLQMCVDGLLDNLKKYPQVSSGEIYYLFIFLFNKNQQAEPNYKTNGENE